MPKIAIIVLNWKQPDLTIQTIDSLLKINNKAFSYKIFLIDNGSVDDSYEIFQNKYKSNKQIDILKTKSNLGFVGGNNFGIKEVLKNNFEYILLINNDVLVHPDFLQNLTIELENNKHLGIVGPKIYFAPEHEFHYDRYTKNQRGKVIWSVGGKMDWNNIIGSNLGVDEVDMGQFNQSNSNLDFISGCCMLIKSEIFKKIGLLNDQYFMYLEDVDFCQRAKIAGYGLAFVPNSIIWHINSGSSTSGGALHDYFISRNRLIFGIKFAKTRTKLALIKESIKILLNSKNKWKQKAVLDFYFRKLGKGSWK